MRVLLLTQYFAPEIGATQNRMAAFAAALAAAGHDVEVLTEVPNHPSGVVPPAYRAKWIYRETGDGFRVTRVWVMTAVRKTFATRATFYLSFLLMVLAAAAARRRRYDVVVATTPPLTVALAGLLLSRLKRIPFVADVRDLWPEAAAALGELSNPVLYRLALRIERAVYRGAAAITATTQPFCDHITRSGARPGAVTLVPNGTQPDVFAPDEQAGRDLRKRYGFEPAFVVGYVGLHGIAQGLDVLLDAAALSRDVAFVLVGEGPRKRALTIAAACRKLDNVHFLPEVPVSEVRGILSAADVLIVPLAPDPVFSAFVPSKLFDAMAASRPIILMVDGQAREILDAAHAGVFVPPGNAAALSEAIARLRGDEALRRQMGESGRRYVIAHYDRARQASQFASIVAAAAGPA